MEKTLVKKFKNEYITNKGRILEDSIRRHYDSTALTELDNVKHTVGSDLTVNGIGYNIKASLASLGKLQENETLEDFINRYLQEDFSSHYMIAVDTTKYINTDKEMIAVITMDKEEMKQFLLEVASIDSGKLRLKKSDLFLSKYFFRLGL